MCRGKGVGGSDPGVWVCGNGGCSLMEILGGSLEEHFPEMRRIVNARGLVCQEASREAREVRAEGPDQEGEK